MSEPVPGCVTLAESGSGRNNVAHMTESEVFSKYPIKAGKVMIPKGAKGTVLNQATDRIKSSFPNIKFNKTSNQVLVKFDGADEIIVDKSQIIFK